MGYCADGHTRRTSGIDAGNTFYEACLTCYEVWSFGRWPDDMAAVLRTALSCGRSFERAYRMAQEYDSRELVERPLR